MRPLIPPIKCYLEGGEKANPYSNVNLAFTQCSVFLRRHTSFAAQATRRCHPHHLSHVAQSPAKLHQYKCDSLMYKLTRHTVCAEDRRRAWQLWEYITAHLITYIFFTWQYLFFSRHISFLIALTTTSVISPNSSNCKPSQYVEFFLLKIWGLQLHILAVKSSWPPAGNPWKITTPWQLLFLVEIREINAGQDLNTALWLILYCPCDFTVFQNLWTI